MPEGAEFPQVGRDDGKETPGRPDPFAGLDPWQQRFARSVLETRRSHPGPLNVVMMPRQHPQVDPYRLDTCTSEG